MANAVKDKDLHRIVLTCIIYNKENKFLITKRSPNQKVYPNKWTVPGGGLEADDYLKLPKTTDEGWYEVLDDVLKREIKEEVNLDIGFPKLLVDMVFVRPDGVPVVVLSYYAPYKSGEVELEGVDTEGDESETSFAWVTVKEAKSYDLIPGIYEEIVMADEILKGNNEARIKFNG